MAGGEAGLAHYNVSKFGVFSLTMTLAIELAPHNIRVNTVCPGLIKTRLTPSDREVPAGISDCMPKIPMERFGRPEEVAAGVAFLASEDSGFITGHRLAIDGGQLTF